MGALSTTLCDGRLGPVCFDGQELWHGVHFLLRDRHWRTPAPHVRLAAREVTAAGWRVLLSGGFDGEPGLDVRLEIEGREDGTLCFTGEARLAADVEVNRLGLCLLHPLACAGQALEVQHDDGRNTRSTFPELIPAWPPFTAIRALRHEWAPGQWASAEFDGDSFEFEDQRNNADASFKTYSRSNAMPRPYRLRAGETVRQQVRLRVESRPSEGGASAQPRLHSVASAAVLPNGTNAATAAVATMPAQVRLGVEITADDLGTPAASAARAATLRPDHLHFAVSARAGLAEGQAQALAQVLSAARATLRVDVLDLVPEQSANVMQGLRRALGAAGIGPAELAVFPTTHEGVAAARAAFSLARIGGGTPDFFVQLNRAERLPPLDFLSFTVCPIVHAADDATVMRSHLSLRGMFDTLRVRHPGMPVHLGPSRIACRRSPLGALAASDGRTRVPLAGTDPRDAGMLGAAWMALHIMAALDAGARCITVSSLALCVEGSPPGGLMALLGRRTRKGGLRADPPFEDRAMRTWRVATAAGHHAVFVNAGAVPIEVDVPGRGAATLAPYSLLEARIGRPLP